MPNQAALLEAAHNERNRFIAFAFAFAVVELVIEADEEGNILFSAGVDHGQGWHFAKPGAKLPCDGGAYGGTAIPASRTDFDPTVGRRVTAR